MNITASNVREMSRSAAAPIVAGIVDNQQAIAQGGIDTPLRLWHFMAQLAHESAHFTVTREFASGAAYEGRKDLGNTRGGDGRRYRGRGLIQSTGRANYQDARNDIRKLVPTAPDFEDDPEELEQFPWALLAGISYWRRKKINVEADRDDVEAVTIKINGGTNGLPERERYLQRAKAIWMADSVPAASNSLLRVGDRGDAVLELQKELVEAGYPLWPDGTFGEYTKSAVIAFQSRRGLVPDGVVGTETMAALRSGRG